MKNNLTYYQHNVNSHNHWKFKTLRRKYKWDGEGKFWALNNMIGDSDGCQLNINDDDRKACIAADLDFDIPEFEEYIDYLVKVCKLVKYEDGCLSTSMTQENLEEVNDKRERQRNWKKNKSTDENAKSTSTLPNSNIENEQSKLKESKESKVKESKIDGAPTAPAPASSLEKPEKRKRRENFIPPSREDIQKFFIEKIGGKWGEAKAKTQADVCYDHYTANGWVQGKGKPIVDWPATCRNWIRREMTGEFSNQQPRTAKEVSPKSAPIVLTQPKPIQELVSEEEKIHRLKEFVNDLYDEHLDGSLRLEFISTGVYDFLKKDGRMKMQQSATESIKKQAKEKRITELRASTNTEEMKLLALFTEEAGEAFNEEIGFIKIAKRLALVEFFEVSKKQGLSQIYEPCPVNI